ncbi:hypothetical protein Cs7R123_79620 [Catellatospora sp. TT07R-123]|uniref:hypothetical protein n=1 Tax=Catellatospora sp. TT07R-123 TaxID=2733863 RepID=UPI001B0C0202|nr:hypothetical protein [Catellatospora sp. TT07R-123]GHJ50620.1 hypothetical protein Cs7R123_79620 [Catellatospora sp. TT07R-123]
MKLRNIAASTVAAALLTVLTAPMPAAAGDIGPLCVDEVSANAQVTQQTLPLPEWAKNTITVTYNGCHRAVRAYIHCNNFPLGTYWDFGTSTYNVGSTSAAMCDTPAWMSYGYEYKDAAGTWIRVRKG